jgi:hypothetical protein
MRSIKSYAWEGAFLNQLSSTRASELGTIQEAATLRAILVAFLGATPAIVAMVRRDRYKDKRWKRRYTHRTFRKTQRGLEVSRP